MQGITVEVTKGIHKYIITSRLWVPLAIAVCITILSGSAGVQTGALNFTGIDKIGHLVVFGLLGIAVARSFKHPGDNWKAVLAASVAFATGFGLLDEVHQLHNPMRTFEWADLLADFLGSLLASTLYLRWHGLRKLLELEISRFLRLRFPAKR